MQLHFFAILQGEVNETWSFKNWMHCSLVIFSEHHPRCEECTAWLKLQIRERGCAQKDKQLALFLSLVERRTLVICFRKKDQSPGLMCIQAQQGSRGFWVTWRLGVHKWTGLDWACGRGDWHGSDQLCVNSSCLPAVIADRSLCKSPPRTTNG